MYDEYEPAGELGKFKEIVARCLGCTKEDALRTLNVTLEKVLHLKPLHEYGFKEEDVKAFALSVDANQQRLDHQLLPSVEHRAQRARIQRVLLISVCNA